MEEVAPKAGVVFSAKEEVLREEAKKG